MTRRAWCIFLPILLSACAHPDPEPAPYYGFIRGTAKVLTVNQALGQATLDYEGYITHAYWQTEAVAAQPGSVLRQGPLKPPVGEYKEPETHLQVFPAKPGEYIAFTGLRTGHEIFLRSVAPVGNSQTAPSR